MTPASAVYSGSSVGGASGGGVELTPPRASLCRPTTSVSGLDDVRSLVGVSERPGVELGSGDHGRAEGSIGGGIPSLMLSGGGGAPGRVIGRPGEPHGARAQARVGQE